MVHLRSQKPKPRKAILQQVNEDSEIVSNEQINNKPAKKSGIKAKKVTPKVLRGKNKKGQIQQEFDTEEEEEVEEENEEELKEVDDDGEAINEDNVPDDEEEEYSQNLKAEKLPKKQKQQASINEKKRGRPCGKKRKLDSLNDEEEEEQEEDDNAKENNINKLGEDKSSKSDQKGKRGFKRCKNDSCNQLIYIHQKVCPHCKYEHKMQIPSFEKKQKTKNQKTSSTFEILRSFLHLGKNDQAPKIKKKDKLPIQQVKKNALYLDQFNLEVSRLDHMFQEGTKKVKIENKEYLPLNIEKRVQIKPLKELETKIRIEFEGEEHLRTLQHFEHFSISSLKNAEQQKPSKPTQTKINDFLLSKKKQISGAPPPTNDWIMWMLNFGYPVTNLAWQYSVREDQFLAVGLNLSGRELKEDKQQVKRTLEAYNLTDCHRIGQKYIQAGCIQIFQVKYDKENKDYLEPDLIGSISTIGTPLKILWKPKYSEDQDHQDIISVLSSDGAIYFYSIPKTFSQSSQHPSNNKLNQSKINPSKLNYSSHVAFEECVQIPYLFRIAIDSEVILSCFDWVNSLECNYLVAGDQVGNIYVCEISNFFQNFTVLQYYNNAHSAIVTDIKVYKQATQEDQILFASCGYDGLILIFDIFGSPFPLFRYQSCLKSVRSVEWDIGGKYLLVNRDKQSFSQIILSLFSTPVSKKIELNPFPEARQLQRLNQDNVAQESCSGIFSQYMFSGNENGLVFGNFNESNRKIAVKKTKKKSPEQEGFKVSTGTFGKDKREYSFVLNDISSLFMNKPGEETNDSKENEIEVEEPDQEDKEDNKIGSEKQKIEFQEIDNRQAISSLDLSKGNISKLEIRAMKQFEGSVHLESFLAYSNQGGIAHIVKIFA